MSWYQFATSACYVAVTEQVQGLLDEQASM